MPSATRSEEVYWRLRADIVGGDLKPGQKLPFALLHERYDASTSVIREALTRLVEQHLVLSEPQQGYRVAAISLRSLGDLTMARCAVESQALRYSVEHGDLQWETNVVATHHALARTPVSAEHDPTRASEAWAQAHAAFHKALLDGCPSTRLTAMAMTLRDSAELYRRWSQPADDSTARPLPEEHLALLPASLDRDSTLAVELLTAHLVETANLLAARAITEGFVDEADTSLTELIAMLQPKANESI